MRTWALLGLSIFIYIPLYLMVLSTGMAGYVLFPVLPEGGIVPAIVTDYMPPVLGALVFVGIAAAVMSTCASLLNPAAMILMLDLGFGRRPGKGDFVFESGNGDRLISRSTDSASYSIYAGFGQDCQ